MRKGFIFFVVMGFTIFASNVVIAQEWSAEQKEVWENVEKFWETSKKGDVDGFLSFVHDDYRGWAYSRHVPGDKAQVANYCKYYFPKTKIHILDINPLVIKIYGNVAFVHYSYREVSTYGENKEKTEKGRWTDIYLKEGNKWLLIGDHGGETK